MAYHKKTGHLPFQHKVKENNSPYMVCIGRSDSQEKWASQLKALKRDAVYISSKEFENILSKGLGEKVELPRDPQLVASYAPNVYVYFEAQKQFCVCVHLSQPSDKSVAYTWEHGTFYSHSLCLGRNQ